MPNFSDSNMCKIKLITMQSIFHYLGLHVYLTQSYIKGEKMFGQGHVALSKQGIELTLPYWRGGPLDGQDGPAKFI